MLLKADIFILATCIMPSLNVNNSDKKKKNYKNIIFFHYSNISIKEILRDILSDGIQPVHTGLVEPLPNSC